MEKRLVEIIGCLVGGAAAVVVICAPTPVTIVGGIALACAGLVLMLQASPQC